MRYLSLIFGLTILLNSCAHFRTSTYKVLDKPEYYLGKKVASTQKTAVMPVYIKQWRVPFNNKMLKALEQLKDQLNAYLQQKGYKIVPSIETSYEDYPVVYFGAIESFDYPGDPDDPEIASYPDVDKPIIVIYKQSPAKNWKDKLKNICSKHGVQYVLVPFLSIGNFKVYQKDWKGNKEIVLGTNFRQPVPWLTSLNDPVEVLYVGGAVVDCNGKIIRVGAEGMLAKRTNFALSVLDFQAAISDEDVIKLLQKKREDLPGKPLVWKTAFENLLQQLLK